MADPVPHCDHQHAAPTASVVEVPFAALERAAGLFRAMGDPMRLRLLTLLSQREWCVSELVTLLGDKFPTVSQRLRLLRTEGLIRRRREGNHQFYALADRHVADLIANAIEHAEEVSRGQFRDAASDTDDEPKETT